MGNRRSFLRNNALLLAGLSIRPSEEAKKVPKIPDAADALDESYWKLLREQFIIDKNRIFLNNGTMGLSPLPVLTAVREALEHTARTGTYGGGEKEALTALAAFTGTQTDEIALVHNVSEAINIVAQGLPFKKGDEIILTAHEHVGNALPWLTRAKRDGLKIVILQLAPTAAETLNRLESLLNKRTRAIALPHIPCTIGQILPVKEMCALAKTRGIFTFIDGAHPPGMLNINIDDIGCDFYASCCHKWMLAPQGTAFLYVRKSKHDAIQPLFVGGGSDKGWDLLTQPVQFKGWADSAHRFYYGTQSAALYKGIEAAVAFQNQIGRDVIETRVRNLATRLQEKLLELGDEIVMLTPTETASRGAQIGFKMRSKSMQALQEHLHQKLITVRYVPENGINCLRISTHIYNNHDETDQLVEEVKLFMKQ